MSLWTSRALPEKDGRKKGRKRKRQKGTNARAFKDGVTVDPPPCDLLHSLVAQKKQKGGGKPPDAGNGGETPPDGPEKRGPRPEGRREKHEKGKRPPTKEKRAEKDASLLADFWLRHILALRSALPAWLKEVGGDEAIREGHVLSQHGGAIEEDETDGVQGDRGIERELREDSLQKHREHIFHVPISVGRLPSVLKAFGNCL